MNLPDGEKRICLLISTEYTNVTDITSVQTDRQTDTARRHEGALMRSNERQKHKRCWPGPQFFCLSWCHINNKPTQMYM